MILANTLSNRAQRRKDKYMNEKSDNALSEYKWGNMRQRFCADEAKEVTNAEAFEYGILAITEDDKLTPEEKATMGSYNWGIESPYPAPSKGKLKFAKKQRYISKRKRKQETNQCGGVKSPTRRNNSRLKYN